LKKQEGKRMRQRLGLSHLLAATGLTILLSGAAPAQDKSSAGKNPVVIAQGEPSAITRGRAVYQQRCEICHFNASEAKKIGPGLKGIYKRGKFADGRRVDDASMERWIVEGGKDMPPSKGVLNPSHIRDLLSYLKTL
jgi:cytochrome c